MTDDELARRKRDLDHDTRGALYLKFKTGGSLIAENEVCCLNFDGTVGNGAEHGGYYPILGRATLIRDGIVTVQVRGVMRLPVHENGRPMIGRYAVGCQGKEICREGDIREARIIAINKPGTCDILI